jgi:cbb3-type cytochrome oxidase subunit 1
MRGLGKGFFVSALVYGVLGMLLGLHMAISNNHGQMPTHAHIMVIGWVSFAIFGLFYAMFENFVPQALARIHFWLAQVSLAALVVGLLLVYSGRPQFEPILPAVRLRCPLGNAGAIRVGCDQLHRRPRASVPRCPCARSRSSP